ncbi:unnamed protein product, partial [Prorocentrum cordatum]
ENFPSLGYSIYTLFKAVTGGVSWGEVSDPLQDVSLVFLFSFPVYIVVTMFCVLNIAIRCWTPPSGDGGTAPRAEAKFSDIAPSAGHQISLDEFMILNFQYQDVLWIHCWVAVVKVTQVAVQGKALYGLDQIKNITVAMSALSGTVLPGTSPNTKKAGRKLEPPTLQKIRQLLDKYDKGNYALNEYQSHAQAGTEANT